jgi:hypothetical protein
MNRDDSTAFFLQPITLPNDIALNEKDNSRFVMGKRVCVAHFSPIVLKTNFSLIH